MARALDCRAKHRWYEANRRTKGGVLAHCPPSSNWVPGGNTGEAKGGEERNRPPYLTIPTVQDSFPLLVRGKSAVLRPKCAHCESSMKLGTVVDLDPNAKNPMRTHLKTAPKSHDVRKRKWN